jgi:hypothetical protein
MAEQVSDTHTKRAIQVRVSTRSLARFIRVKRMNKLIAGELIEVSFFVRNTGASNFPDKPLNMVLRIHWVTDQIVDLDFPLMTTDAIKPGEERHLGTRITNCMTDGYALLYLRVMPQELPFEGVTVTTEEGTVVDMEFGGSVQTSNDGSRTEFWSSATSRTAIHSMWAHRWQEVYGFWVFVLSAITALSAILVLFLAIS